MRWARANPERRRKINNRYASKPEVVRRHVEADLRRKRAKRLAARIAGKVEVYRCLECGAEWCPAPWSRGMAGRGEFCEERCRLRYRYHQRHPDARRRRTRGMPAPQPLRPAPATLGSSTHVAQLPAPAAPPPPLRQEVLEPFGEGPDLPAWKPPKKSDAAVRLAQLRGEVDSATVQYELEVSRDAAHALLARLARAGRLIRSSNGVYALPEGTA